MAATLNPIHEVGHLVIDITGDAATTGGGIGAILNPEGAALHIIDSILVIDTASTGAANISVGVGTTATTSATDLINALTANGSVTGVYNGIAKTVTANTTYGLAWGATSYLTITGSATTEGFVGKLLIQYIRL